MGGCWSSGEPGPGPKPAVSDKPPAATVKPISVRLVDEKEFRQALERCRGSAVLVDYWALWCSECMQRFPHTVWLHRQYSDRGLRVVSLSLDDPSDEAQVLKFLTAKGADFDNFISRYGGSTQTIENFGLGDGALPRIELYDRDGKLFKVFSAGSFTDQQVEEAVKELLFKQPAG